MSEGTKIEWATHSWNPWEGCTKVSPGCTNCYAEARNRRFSGGANWGKGKPRRRTSAANWKQPARWNLQSSGGVCCECGQIYAGPTWKAIEAEQFTCHGAKVQWRRPRVFPSLCDWLDDEVPIEWLADFLKLIHDTPNLDWLLLTKRPENFMQRMDAVGKLWACDGGYRETRESIVYHDMVCPWRNGEPPANVWIGTSVEDQLRADERIPALLKIPARVRFLSVEPLLGPVNLAEICFNGADSFGTLPGIDWIIIGGESGPGARPCNIEWIRDVVRQCQTAGVACFVKQFGSNARQLKHPKGGDPSEWPEDLRVREFPNYRQPAGNAQMELLRVNKKPARA